MDILQNLRKGEARLGAMPGQVFCWGKGLYGALSEDPWQIERRRRGGDVGRLLKQCLETGRSVEIDGLGKFRPLSDGRFEFVAENTTASLFLPMWREDFRDCPRVSGRVYRRRGFSPWLDKQKAICQARTGHAQSVGPLEISDFFVPCFSRQSTYKRGTFSMRTEVRFLIALRRCRSTRSSSSPARSRAVRSAQAHHRSNSIRGICFPGSAKKAIRRVVGRDAGKQVKLRVGRRLTAGRPRTPYFCPTFFLHGGRFFSPSGSSSRYFLYASVAAFLVLQFLFPASPQPAARHPPWSGSTSALPSNRWTAAL